MVGEVKAYVLPALDLVPAFLFSFQFFKVDNSSLDDYLVVGVVLYLQEKGEG